MNTIQKPAQKEIDGIFGLDLSVVYANDLENDRKNKRTKPTEKCNRTSWKDKVRKDLEKTRGNTSKNFPKIQRK